MGHTFKAFCIRELQAMRAALNGNEEESVVQSELLNARVQIH